MQEDKQKVNNSAIVFRKWVDFGKNMSPESFKRVFLALFGYILDGNQPALSDPVEKMSVDFFLDDYMRYKEYRQKEADRIKAWREKKNKEMEELKAAAQFVCNSTYSNYGNLRTTLTQTPTPTLTPTPTPTPEDYNLSSQLETTEDVNLSIPKSKVLPFLSVCVSKDAGAREGAQDTHTQEVPEGVQLTAEQLEDVKKRYPSDWREVLTRFASRLAAGYNVADHYSTLIKWTEEDKKRQRGASGNRGSTPKAESRGSFDTDDFFEAALHRSYDDL